MPAPNRPPVPAGSDKLNYDELVAYQYSREKVKWAVWGLFISTYVVFRVIPKHFNPASFRQKFYLRRYDEAEKKHYTPATKHIKI